MSPVPVSIIRIASRPRAGRIGDRIGIIYCDGFSGVLSEAPSGLGMQFAFKTPIRKAPDEGHQPRRSRARRRSVNSGEAHEVLRGDGSTGVTGAVKLCGTGSGCLLPVSEREIPPEFQIDRCRQLRRECFAQCFVPTRDVPRFSTPFRFCTGSKRTLPVPHNFLILAHSASLGYGSAFDSILRLGVDELSEQSIPGVAALLRLRRRSRRSSRRATGILSRCSFIRTKSRC